ncbi:MAG: ATP-binding protein [Promethearchaeota archaeon]|nr:MAG: ATP-binding protein [Candidatus Lokiarchaeota archaeon]
MPLFTHFAFMITVDTFSNECSVKNSQFFGGIINSYLIKILKLILILHDNMAKIIGQSDCTSYLVYNLQHLGGDSIQNFENVKNFRQHFGEIVKEEKSRAKNRLDGQIRELNTKKKHLTDKLTERKGLSRVILYIKKIFTSYKDRKLQKNYLHYGTLVIEINEDKIEMGTKRKKVIKESEYAQFFNVQPNLLENLVLYIPMHTDIVKKIEKEIKEHKDLIMKKGYHMEVAKMLNKCVDDKYSDIAFLEPISIRKELPNNFVYLPLKDLGSGAENFVSLVSFIEIIKPKLLLIDDFETGFHPSLIRTFIKWLKKKYIQVVLSTHSIDVLDGLVEIQPESTRVILLKKNEADILKHKIFPLQKLQDFLNANTDPRYLIDQLKL